MWFKFDLFPTLKVFTSQVDLRLRNNKPIISSQSQTVKASNMGFRVSKTILYVYG